MDNKTYEYVEDRSMTIQQYINNIFKWMIIGVLTTFVTAFCFRKIIIYVLCRNASLSF